MNTDFELGKVEEHILQVIFNISFIHLP
jgi:hypothetical protein